MTNGALRSANFTKRNMAQEKIVGANALGTALASMKGKVDTRLSGKVDVVAGMGLSSNDYTLEDKAKVAVMPNFWVGTQDQYDAIATKDDKTFYFITE